MADFDWAGRGFSSTTERARAAARAAEIGFQALTRRVRKIEISRLPQQGAASASSALGLPAGQHAVIHFYGPDGSYLHTTVVREGGVTMMWEGASYWRAEPVPLRFDAHAVTP